MKKVYKRTSILFVLILTVIALISFAGCSCNETETNSGKTPSLTVNQAVISLKPYETFNIVATWTGDGEVIWSTADAAVATVSNGMVTGVKPGQTVVTVTAGDLSKNCYITVLTDEEVPTLSANNTDNGVVQLNVEDEYNLDVSVKFAGKIVDASLKYTASDDEIITVDENGKILAKKIGEAYVYVEGSWREFDENTINAVIKVVVKAKVSFNLSMSQTGIYAVARLDGEQFVQETLAVPSLRIEGKEYTEGFTFESSDPSIATVNNNGVVKGQKIGQTVITCYYDNGGERLFAKTSVEVLPIIREKQLSDPLILELSTNPTVKDVSSIFADKKEAVKIVDVTDTLVDVKIDDDKAIVNDETLVTGERVWEVYNQAYAYRVNVLVADYVLTTAERFKAVLPGIERDAYIILGNNIANVGDYSGWNTFAGTFDGRGYAISDVNIKSRGFFGLLNGGATIKNLAVSNVTLQGTSGVFGVQADSATIDNVSVWITGVSPTDTAPCGGLVFQIGGTLNVRNTLVYVEGVNGANFGAVTGAWWSGTYNLTNSYFITDGTPCGNVYKTSSNENNNDNGVMENAKGSWNYIYPTMQAFEEELVKADSNINLGGFNREYWTVSSSSVPIITNDIAFRTLMSDQIDGTKKGGELFYFSKNVTIPTGYAAKNVENGYYNVEIPEQINGDVTGVFLGSQEIVDFKFSAAKRTVGIPVAALEEVICGQNNVLIVTEEGSYRCVVTVADYVIQTGDDLQAVLPEVTGKEYIVLGANVLWNSAKTYDRKTNPNFSGTFDGKGHVIKNFRQNRSLFNTLQPGAIIKNIGLIDVKNYGYNRGTLAGDISKNITLENVVVTVSVSGGSFGLFGRLAVVGAPVTLKNTIVAFEQQNAAIAHSYIAGAQLVMENSYVVSSKLPFSSDLGDADTYDVYQTAVNATCANLTELLKKSGNLSEFDKNYWSFDSYGNVVFGNAIVFGTDEWFSSSDSFVEDYEGWETE